MKDLMEKLIKEIPEIKQKEKLIVALIKTEIHREKYINWKYLIDKFYHYPAYFKKRIIDNKIKTHKELSNLDKNIEWANKYYTEVKNEKN